MQQTTTLRLDLALATSEPHRSSEHVVAAVVRQLIAIGLCDLVESGRVVYEQPVSVSL